MLVPLHRLVLLYMPFAHMQPLHVQLLLHVPGTFGKIFKVQVSLQHFTYG